MKKVLLFIGILLGIFIFIQCNKTTGVEDNSIEKTALRSGDNLQKANFDDKINNTNEALIPSDNDLDCHSVGHPGANCYTLEKYSIEVEIDPDATGIPESVIGECKADAIFDIMECISGDEIKSVEFDNFMMYIHENDDCDNLKQWLDNLSENDPDTYADVMNDLSGYVAQQGKLNFMNSFIDANDLENSFETKTYLVKCYTLVTMSELIPIYDKTVEGKGDIIGYITKDVYEFWECGQGCCIDYIDYYYDKETGEFTTHTYTYSAGHCEPLNYGLGDREQVIDLRGGGGSGGCHQRCNDD